jgi:hypothetical protein
MVSEPKRPTFWKGLDPPLTYMYIVLQCCLSSIVEYGATNYVVNKINMMSCNEAKRTIVYADDLKIN